MTNPEITQNDTSKLEVFNPIYQQDVAKFGTAETRPEGQILARKQLSDTVTPAPDGGNTGDGVLSAAGLAAGGPAKVGAYNLECVEAIANSGRFKLEDPDSLLLDSQIIIPVSSNLTYAGHGLTFNLADGATDFIVGDKFSLTTTADGDLDSYAADGVDGTEIPVALMPYARTEAVAESYPQRVLVKGEVSRAVVEAAQGGSVGKVLTDKLAAIGIVLRQGAILDVEDND